MRVLVTGATGLVGSHTVRALLTGGHSVRVLVRNLGKADNVFGPDTQIEAVVGDMTDSEVVTTALAGGRRGRALCSGGVHGDSPCPRG